jgi:hypothetical protein
MKSTFLFLLILCGLAAAAQDSIAAQLPDIGHAPDSIRPRSLIYHSKQIMANSAWVHDKETDSLIVVFQDHMIYSNGSLRQPLWHLTDAAKKVRYSALTDKNTFKMEKVNTDTTFFKYTYVKLTDTVMWHGYVAVKHKFTMKDNFTGTTYTVVLYECPEIKINPEFSKYYFSEVFFLKVPLRLNGAIVKAVAEQRIDNKPVMRAELVLMRFNDDAAWKGVTFQTPIEQNYTFMLPDGTKKEREYAKELLEDLSGRKDYPTISYKQEFEHE